MADINLGVGGANSASDAYEIANSLKLEADNSERLKSNNTHAYSTPTSSKIGTFSFWVKRTELGANYMIVSGNSARYSRMFFNSSDQIQLYSGDSSWNSVQPITNAVFRDTSAWYHIVLRLDSTDSTAANRLRLYVNGEEQTWSTSPNITQDGALTLCEFGGPTWHSWGSNLSYFSPSAYFSGYLAEVHYVDGQALAPTEFGETDSGSGIWKPKEYDGTYGNSGYYMDFEDASNLGDDESGNGFDFDENNIAAADQATDTPTNNFCILNTNHRGNYYKAPTEGGTYIPMNGVNQDAAYAGTIGVTQGKWYYETYIDMRSSTYGLTVYVGYHTFQDKYQDNAYWSNTDQESFAGYLMHGGTYYSWDSGSRVLDSNPAGLGTSQVGQFVGVALNLDDNQISFYVNGSAISNATNLALNDLGDETDTGIFALPAISVYHNNHTVNFGGYTKATISSPQSDANGYGTFEHAPPSGYYALCSKNLAEFG